MERPATTRIEQALARLARSAFRKRFRLSDRDARYLSGKGSDVVRDHARAFIAQRLAPAQPVNDGKQTPFRGHPVFVAQHATATCCRGCLAKWHGLAPGRTLTDVEQAYVVEVICRWLAIQAESRPPPSEPAKVAKSPHLDPQLTLIRE